MPHQTSPASLLVQLSLIPQKLLIFTGATGDSRAWIPALTPFLRGSYLLRRHRPRSALQTARLHTLHRQDFLEDV